eukprot:Tbor_TRINITY_DN5787_c0_g1::TRINITY_DN5787_c0_g1_i1::g.20851::m.20851
MNLNVSDQISALEKLENVFLNHTFEFDQDNDIEPSSCSPYSSLEVNGIASMDKALSFDNTNLNLRFLLSCCKTIVSTTLNNLRSERDRTVVNEHNTTLSTKGLTAPMFVSGQFGAKVLKERTSTTNNSINSFEASRKLEMPKSFLTTDNACTQICRRSAVEISNRLEEVENRIGREFAQISKEIQSLHSKDENIIKSVAESDHQQTNCNTLDDNMVNRSYYEAKIDHIHQIANSSLQEVNSIRAESSAEICSIRKELDNKISKESISEERISSITKEHLIKEIQYIDDDFKKLRAGVESYTKHVELQLKKMYVNLKVRNNLSATMNRMVASYEALKVRMANMENSVSVILRTDIKDRVQQKQLMRSHGCDIREIVEHVLQERLCYIEDSISYVYKILDLPSLAECKAHTDCQEQHICLEKQKSFKGQIFTKSIFNDAGFGKVSPGKAHPDYDSKAFHNIFDNQDIMSEDRTREHHRILQIFQDTLPLRYIVESIRKTNKRVDSIQQSLVDVEQTIGSTSGRQEMSGEVNREALHPDNNVQQTFRDRCDVQHRESLRRILKGAYGYDSDDEYKH